MAEAGSVIIRLLGGNCSPYPTACPECNSADMIQGAHMKRREPDTSSRPAIDKGAKRVARALKEATHGRVNTNDPIMEQLKQCPEAFKVGEILGKGSAPLKAAQHEGGVGAEYSPPGGTVFPPLV